MNLKHHLKKGEIVFHEGNPSDFAYIIGSGSIEIFDETADGQKVLGVLGKNDLFGEMGLIDGLPRSATARAREDSVVYVLTPESFDNLVLENPEALVPILRILSTRLIETMRCLKLGYKIPGNDRRMAVQGI